MASAGASESAWRLESSTVSSFLMRFAIEAGWALEHKKKFSMGKVVVSQIHKSKKSVFLLFFSSTVKLGNKERFDKEQIGIKEPFPVTNLPFTS